MHDRDTLCALLPHAAEMCLIESVTSYDNDGIICRTQTHLNPSNPLRYENRLNTICGVEYAAQAMALHSALLSDERAKPRVGFLAGLREVTLHVPRLDVIATTLHIKANKLIADSGRSIYEFLLSLDERPALSGRAAVIIPNGGNILSQPNS